MELYVFNQSDRKLAGIIEAYEYLRWTRRYSRCGSFELKAMATEANLALLQIGNILWKSDDEEAALIEFEEVTMEEREIITAAGRFATGFMARRIVLETEIISGDLGAGIGLLVDKNLINPTDPSRKIAGVSFSPAVLGKAVNTQISYRNLMDTVTNLCEAADVGIKTTFNPKTGLFQFVPYIGGTVQSVFSREYENIIGQIFTQSIVEYATFALVGGEGEGAERVFATTGGGAGEFRHEIFVDARDLRVEDFPGAYEAALIFRGDTRLAELAMVQAFDATINQFGNLAYKIDYDIGNKIQVVSKPWGVTLNARITEIEENYDREGMSINATFGRPLLTIDEKIKRAGGI